jgi:hypothetical protein
MAMEFEEVGPGRVTGRVIEDYICDDDLTLSTLCSFFPEFVEGKTRELTVDEERTLERYRDKLDNILWTKRMSALRFLDYVRRIVQFYAAEKPDYRDPIGEEKYEEDEKELWRAVESYNIHREEEVRRVAKFFEGPFPDFLQVTGFDELTRRISPGLYGPVESREEAIRTYTPQLVKGIERGVHNMIQKDHNVLLQMNKALERYYRRSYVLVCRHNNRPHEMRPMTMEIAPFPILRHVSIDPRNGDILYKFKFRPHQSPRKMWVEVRVSSFQARALLAILPNFDLVDFILQWADLDTGMSL